MFISKAQLNNKYRDSVQYNQLFSKNNWRINHKIWKFQNAQNMLITGNHIYLRCID